MKKILDYVDDRINDTRDHCLRNTNQIDSLHDKLNNMIALLEGDINIEDKLEIAIEALEFYAEREYYPSGGMPFFPKIDRNKDTQKRAKEALKRIRE